VKKRIVIRIAIVVAFIAAGIMGRGFFYYQLPFLGFYTPPPTEMPSYENITVPPAPIIEFSPTVSEEHGTILIDLAHDNNFAITELGALTLQLVSRNLSVDLFGLKDSLKRELLGEEEEEGAPAVKEEAKADEEKEEEEVLPNAFIVVAPQVEFTREERETAVQFVENGGKLLLISDPTRGGEINTLSIDFGLIFEPGYLYNMAENEVNYRNIFVSEFRENEITKDVVSFISLIDHPLSS
jgi:hypothetical protein